MESAPVHRAGELKVLRLVVGIRPIWPVDVTLPALTLFENGLSTIMLGMLFWEVLARVPQLHVHGVPVELRLGREGIGEVVEVFRNLRPDAARAVAEAHAMRPRPDLVLPRERQVDSPVRVDVPTHQTAAGPAGVALDIQRCVCDLRRDGVEEGGARGSDARRIQGRPVAGELPHARTGFTVQRPRSSR